MKRRKVLDLDAEIAAVVVVSQLAESFYILFSLSDANTQQRGEERLPAAKLFPQLSQQLHIFFTLLKTFLPSLHPDNEQYTFYSMCTCAQVLHVACTVCFCCTLLSCSQGALDNPDFRASSKNIAVGLNRVYCRKHRQL